MLVVFSQNSAIPQPCLLLLLARVARSVVALAVESVLWVRSSIPPQVPHAVPLLDFQVLPCGVGETHPVVEVEQVGLPLVGSANS